MDEIKEFWESRSTANLLMIIVNVLVFVILEMRGNTEDVEFMLQSGASYAPYIVEEGKYYLLLTCMFLHFGIEHLIYNMLVLLFLGDILEKHVGKIRYLLIYLLGGIAGNCLSVFVDMQRQEFYVSAGASGAGFAIIGAIFWLVIKNKGRLGDIPGQRLAVLIVLSVIEGFTSAGVDGYAHMGGLLAGFLLCALLTISMRRQTDADSCAL